MSIVLSIVRNHGDIKKEGKKMRVWWVKVINFALPNPPYSYYVTCIRENLQQ